MRLEATRQLRYVGPSDPPGLSQLFSSPTFAWIWLLVRLFVGYQWLNSGIGKLGNPAWTVTGEALKGFWTRAVSIPATGSPPVTYDWYRAFLNTMLEGGHYTWFSKLVVAGELLVGLALILGAFVAVAAVFGAFMNLNYMLAGTASSNPVLFTLAILLVLAWRIAGYWGLDRWLLVHVGMPWDWLRRNRSSAVDPTASEATS